MGPPKPTDDILWKQYELHVELYKHYLKLLLEFNIFYYAATGAIVSYYFSNPEIPWMRFSLLFPVLMRRRASRGCSYIRRTVVTSRDKSYSFDIRDYLGLRTAPEYMVLKMFLWVSAVLMLAVAASLLVVVIFVRLPFQQNNEECGGTIKQDD